jgi:hypothetical protein
MKSENNAITTSILPIIDEGERVKIRPMVISEKKKLMKKGNQTVVMGLV